MARLNPVERRMSRFLSEPVSVRNAASVIAVSTTCVVLASGIAFVSILVAAITSSFITRAEHERERENAQAQETADDRDQARFDDLVQRLDRLEQALSRLVKQ